MRPNSLYACEDPSVVARLIDEHPWGTIVSATAGGIVASHYPVLRDAGAADLTVLTHLGRPDERVHELADRELLLIVQGEHGYVSPSWYGAGAPQVPTWDFVVAHCYGVPEILSREENLAVLGRLVERFERDVDRPLPLDPHHALGLIDGTIGIRMRIERFVCKRKLSQELDPASRASVIERLRADGPYRQPALAAEIERARQPRPPGRNGTPPA